MGTRPPAIEDVVSGHMCTGCGACAYIDASRLQMIDTATHTRRPQARADEPRLFQLPILGNPGAIESDSTSAAAVCPGINWPAAPPKPTTGHPELHAEWGPVLEIWEGFAVDPEIRFRGSSGGVVTALALYCIELGGMEGALHVRARTDAPLLNETVLSRNRESLVKGAGSRYSPASPCEELGQIENAASPCVFIGKPCDVAGAVKAREIRPQLDRNLGLTIAIFCAGAPSIQGTIELAKTLGANDPTQIESVRYRGQGWPGEITATWRDELTGASITKSISYEEGWGKTLQKHRAWRCHVCADHTGEMADVSVGDPWYRPIGQGDPGRSLVLVRTERGRQLVREAVERGYLVLERRESWVVEASQSHLLRARGSTWGRAIVSRLLGVSAPRHTGMPLFSSWWKRLGLKARLQSLTGTLTRVFKKRLRAVEHAVPLTTSGLTRADRTSNISIGAFPQGLESFLASIPEPASIPEQIDSSREPLQAASIAQETSCMPLAR
ncbi:MAG: coenzyme hydrogenase [Planctomycetaceae bacterium]|nr:coenzyme hydrogenase [Planctomycetaceae bacterium]